MPQAKKNSVALVIIYNHRYDDNIEIIERIYKGKFTNIYHLMPFYTGSKPNVIATYDNSEYFHGYVAQGFKFYFREEYNHYFFIADDMVLNPIINENNYTEHLRLESETCFMPEKLDLGDMPLSWKHTKDIYYCDIKDIQGVEITSALPSYDRAKHLFEKHGLSVKPLQHEQVYPVKRTRHYLHRLRREIFSPSQKNIGNFHLFIGIRLVKSLAFISKMFKKKYYLSYPIAAGYSDIFVVNASVMKQFAHYCGVFAATRLFVEAAIPTAMVLASKKICTELDTELKGKPLWSTKDYKELDEYNYNLSNLLEHFPKGYIYIHPVKLSKWDTKL